MKALTLTALKAPLQLSDRASLVPGPNEAVVRLKAASLNRRDFWITQGMYPGIELPVVLGSDGSGVVTQTGSSLGNYWEGRDVILNPGIDWGDDPAAQSGEFTVLGMPRDGTFATEVLVPASQLYEKPSQLSWHEAAAIPLAGTTAYRAVFTQGGLSNGQRVLITGVGGGVATFALQFAVAAGAEVWVTSSSPAKIQQAVAAGARGGLNYREEGWQEKLSQTAGPPHLIIDSAGGSGYAALVNLAAPGGRIVNYGATAGPPQKLDLFKVFWKQLRLQGSTMGSPEDFASMLKFVEEKRIHPIIDTVLPLEAGNEAIARMESSPQFGKYVLAID